MTNMIVAVEDPGQVIMTGLLVVVVIAVVVFFLLFMKFFRLWLQAKLSRADVRFSELIGMWLRRVDTRIIVLSKITAVPAETLTTTVCRIFGRRNTAWIR